MLKFAATFVLALAVPLKAQEILKVGSFSGDGLTAWKTKSFAGQTRYRLVPINGQTVLEAEAKASASGLYQEIAIDLGRTPYLNWCWQVAEPLPPLPETTKPGDDYAARIYLVKKGRLAFWRTKALNYVWSSSQPPESLWSNAFAGRNVMMLAVRTGENHWQCEKRNVPADWRRAFGEEPGHIDAVALMTDSDNSKRRTMAYYGDIWFSSD